MAAKSPTEECFFGTGCYRRNPHHFREYGHPHLQELFNKYEGKTPSNSDLAKFEAGAEVVSQQYKVFLDVCKPELRKKNVADSASASSSATDSLEPPSKKAKVDKPNISDSPGTSSTSKVNNNSNSNNGAKRLSPKDKLDTNKEFPFFLTKVKDSPATHNDPKSLYITDLLHPINGKLKRSMQINFMVEWDWLKMNYEVTKTDVR